MFPSTFVHALALVALIWTALGALSLLALLVRDWLKGKLW